MSLPSHGNNGLYRFYWGFVNGIAPLIGDGSCLVFEHLLTNNPCPNLKQDKTLFLTGSSRAFALNDGDFFRGQFVQRVDQPINLSFPHRRVLLRIPLLRLNDAADQSFDSSAL